MTFASKASIVGLIGCVASATIGLSQAKSSLSIKEKLSFDGYVLISEKDTVSKEAWENRVSLYKNKPNNRDLVFYDLDPERVSSDGREIKQKCDYFTNGKILFDKISQEVYNKIINLCTLKINEYHKSNFSREDKFITEDKDWEEIIKNNQSQIKEVVGEAKKEALSKYCLSKYELNQSNKSKDESYNVANWCIKKAKIVEDGEDSEDGKWEIFYDTL